MRCLLIKLVLALMLVVCGNRIAIAASFDELLKDRVKISAIGEWSIFRANFLFSKVCVAEINVPDKLVHLMVSEKGAGAGVIVISSKDWSFSAGSSAIADIKFDGGAALRIPAQAEGRDVFMALAATQYILFAKNFSTSDLFSLGVDELRIPNFYISLSGSSVVAAVLAACST